MTNRIERLDPADAERWMSAPAPLIPLTDPAAIAFINRYASTRSDHGFPVDPPDVTDEWVDALLATADTIFSPDADRPALQIIAIDQLVARHADAPTAPGQRSQRDRWFAWEPAPPPIELTGGRPVRAVGALLLKLAKEDVPGSGLLARNIGHDGDTLELSAPPGAVIQLDPESASATVSTDRGEFRITLRPLRFYRPPQSPGLAVSTASVPSLIILPPDRDVGEPGSGNASRLRLGPIEVRATNIQYLANFPLDEIEPLTDILATNTHRGRMTQHPSPTPTRDDNEPRHAGRAVVAALFAGTALIAAILLWRVYGGG